MLYQTGCSDKFGNKYDIEIITNNSVSQTVQLTCGGDPVTITTQSDSLFAPIKSRSMSLNIVVTQFYPDLYTPVSRGARIRLYNATTSECLFNGYVTPCQYNQSYSSNLDTITLECVDALSTCKDYKWEGENRNYSFFDIIMSILRTAGYTGTESNRAKLWVPESYEIENGADSELLKNLWCSGSNFYQDDEAHTGWTEYEILEEIMQFMGWTMTPYGNDIIITDATMTATQEIQKYTVYNIYNGSVAQNYSDNVERITINDIVAPGTPNITLDNIYNKIEISDNLYEIDTIAPDIFDDDTHISVTEEALYEGNDMLNITRWTKTERKKFLWWTTSEHEEITGYDYQTICRLDPSSGWKHNYYRIADLKNTNSTALSNSNGRGYTDPNPGSGWDGWTNGPINREINTHGCLIQHHAYRPEEGKNNLPSSLDWEDLLTFFVTGPSLTNFSMGLTPNFERPVLEYTINEEVNWRAPSGISWITIKGDLLYQYNGAKYGEKNKSVLTIVNDEAKYYFTAPVTQATDISGQKYCSCVRQYSANSNDYGTGFKCWKMRLAIGEYWWNGDTKMWEWYNPNITGTEPYFYISYNNNPSDRGEEYMSAFEWMSPVPNTDFTDKVGEQAYCIPLDAAHGAPASGKLRLIIYTPALIPDDIRTLFQSVFPNSFSDISWKDLPPVIYCKDFEVGYVYTDTNVWYKQHTDKNESDLVYVGRIDDSYVQDFDQLEFKLNTAQQDRPISRSYVLQGSTAGSLEYLTKMRHIYHVDAREQEHNICDKYMDHYSDRKIVYKCNAHGYMDPRARYKYTQLSDKFVLDSQEWNLQQNNNTIKLIEF